VTLATGMAAAGGVVAFHIGARGSVSTRWYVFFQVLLSLAAVGFEAGGSAPSVRLRARSMAFAVGVLLGVGLLTLASIGAAVIVLAVLNAFAAAQEGRLAGTDPFRRIVGAIGFALPWLGFVAFRP
jgi:hypothetical protein